MSISIPISRLYPPLHPSLHLYQYPWIPLKEPFKGPLYLSIYIYIPIVVTEVLKSNPEEGRALRPWQRKLVHAGCAAQASDAAR